MKTRFLFALLISFAFLSAGTAFAATQTGIGQMLQYLSRRM